MVLFLKVLRYLDNLKNKGFTTQEIATGMTMAILVTTIAVVTGNTLILDTEEKAHVFNAQAMAKAASEIITADGAGAIPKKGNASSFSISDMIAANKFAGIDDPSSETGGEYSSENSVAVVESVEVLGS